MLGFYFVSSLKSGRFTSFDHQFRHENKIADFCHDLELLGLVVETNFKVEKSKNRLANHKSKAERA